MKNKDQIILENLYSKQILKEDVVQPNHQSKPWINPAWWNEWQNVPKQIETLYPQIELRPKQITRGKIANAILSEAEKGIKIEYKIYEDILVSFKDDNERWENGLTYDQAYLNAIEGNGLTGNFLDSEMTQQNKNVNVLTVMNQILYPIKDMDKKYFNDIYENLFRTMAVDSSEPNNKKTYLFTNKNSKYKSMLIDYFGESGFSVHRNYLMLLSQMMVNEFGDDEEFNKDYSSILTLGAFSY